MIQKRYSIFVTIFLLINLHQAIGFANEVSNISEGFEGYTLFAPMSLKTTYLINNNGLLCSLKVVFTFVVPNF